MNKSRRMAFLLPSAIMVLMFYLLPLGYCLIFSFSGSSGRFSFIGFTNFISLLQSDTFQKALSNTYIIMLISMAAVLLLSLIFAYFLDAISGVIKWFVLFSLPMLMPSTLIIRVMQEVVLPPRMALLLIFVWKYMGFHVLLLKVMEMTMKSEWIEAAVIEHASRWQMFRKIRLPFLWPYIRFLMIFDGICFFRLFRENYLLYGMYPPEKVYMISNFFFNNFQNLNYQRLSAAAVIALLPILILNGILLRAGEKNEMV